MAVDFGCCFCFGFATGTATLLLLLSVSLSQPMTAAVTPKLDVAGSPARLTRRIAESSLEGSDRSEEPMHDEVDGLCRHLPVTAEVLDCQRRDGNEVATPIHPACPPGAQVGPHDVTLADREPQPAASFAVGNTDLQHCTTPRIPSSGPPTRATKHQKTTRAYALASLVHLMRLGTRSRCLTAPSGRGSRSRLGGFQGDSLGDCASIPSSFLMDAVALIFDKRTDGRRGRVGSSKGTRARAGRPLFGTRQVGPGHARLRPA